MDRKGIVAIGAGVAAAIVIGFTIFRPSEEDRVRQTLERFVKAVAVKPNDNVLVRLGRLRSEFKETVADDVVVDVSEMNIHVRGRDKLAESATQAAAVYQSADCELEKMTIKLDAASTTAKVDAVAIVRGTRGGERKTDRRNTHFLLFKDGTWRITSLDVGAADP